MTLWYKKIHCTLIVCVFVFPIVFVFANIVYRTFATPPELNEVSSRALIRGTRKVIKLSRRASMYGCFFLQLVALAPLLLTLCRPLSLPAVKLGAIKYDVLTSGFTLHQPFHTWDEKARKRPRRPRNSIKKRRFGTRSQGYFRTSTPICVSTFYSPYSGTTPSPPVELRWGFLLRVLETACQPAWYPEILVEQLHQSFRAVITITRQIK